MKTQFAWTLVSAALLVGCTTPEEEYAGSTKAPDVGTRFSELPPAVQTTIRKQAPNSRIDDIDRETRDGITVYEVSFAEPGLNPKIHVAADGRLLRTGDMIVESAGAAPRRVNVHWNDLPQAVRQTIFDRAPTGLVTDINAVGLGNQNAYEVVFDDVSAGNPKLYIAEDGTLIDEMP